MYFLIMHLTGQSGTGECPVIDFVFKYTNIKWIFTKLLYFSIQDERRWIPTVSGQAKVASALYSLNYKNYSFYRFTLYVIYKYPFVGMLYISDIDRDQRGE